MVYPSNRPLRPIVISSSSSNPILRQLAQQIRRQNEEQRVAATGSTDQEPTSRSFSDYISEAPAMNELQPNTQTAESYLDGGQENVTVESTTNAEDNEAAPFSTKVESALSQQQPMPRKRDSEAAFGVNLSDSQQKSEQTGSALKKVKLNQNADKKDDFSRTIEQKDTERNHTSLQVSTTPITPVKQTAHTEQNYQTVEEDKISDNRETESLAIKQRKPNNESIAAIVIDSENSDLMEVTENTDIEERVVKRRHTKGKDKEAKEGQPADKTNTKAEEEDTQTIKDMQKLTREVQSLRVNYRLITKIGEGTFSKVYLAEDLRYDNYNNSEWTRILKETERMVEGSNTKHATVLENTPAETASRSLEGGDEQLNPRKDSKIALDEKKSYVALKCIHNISSPQRMISELQILKKLKGNPCITPLITSFRESGYIFFVMPYHEADDFRHFFHKLPMIDIKYYMKSLFQGLKALRNNDIIHRDVKPNNFLYNVKKRTGFLIDFGLAEVEPPPEQPRRLTRDGTIFIERIKTALERQPTKGYIPMDPRPSVKANRAGTRGFRAPEVLFRSSRHTCAVDVWSAGVILLCFITSAYPFFLFSEEADGLMELIQIFGMQEMEEVAQKYGRTIATNTSVPTVRRSWRRVVEALNGLQFEKWGNDGILALDLLEKSLVLDADQRITAKEALEHPFFAETR